MIDALQVPSARLLTSRSIASSAGARGASRREVLAVYLDACARAVLSHGMGYTKVRKPETGSVYGLAPEWLLHDGIVVPDVVMLSYERERDRLALATPEALDRAVVAGDPCYDRLRASKDQRQQYRTALGAGPNTTIVTVSSTWGPVRCWGDTPI